jgi:hypothetical protein
MAAEGFVEDAARPPQHDDAYLRTVYACGQRRDHIVKVHRAHWPPKVHPGLNDAPHLVAKCERCGGNVIVYNPPSADLTVQLFGDAADAVGKLVDERGKVIEEAASPKAGTVVEGKR